MWRSLLREKQVFQVYLDQTKDVKRGPMFIRSSNKTPLTLKGIKILLTSLIEMHPGFSSEVTWYQKDGDVSSLFWFYGILWHAAVYRMVVSDGVYTALPKRHPRHETQVCGSQLSHDPRSRQIFQMTSWSLWQATEGKDGRDILYTPMMERYQVRVGCEKYC